MCVVHVAATVVNWESYGGVPDVRAAANNNTRALNAALARLQPGDELFISNKTFWVAGGVRAEGMHDVTIRLDGTLKWLPGRKGWPTRVDRMCGKGRVRRQCVQDALYIANASKLTLSSSGTGRLDGSGAAWWGYAEYLIYQEDRPVLVFMHNITDLLIEHWHFVQSPYHTFEAHDTARVEIRYCAVDNRVNSADAHGVLNLRALNTDGFDVSGRDIHIHLSTVWNQDDCFTILATDSNGINAKCTENVLIEHVNASGLGLTIGSVSASPAHSCVNNITFRHATMHHTFKGIYIKAAQGHSGSAAITNVLYDDVSMDAPEQVPIWIGPAQEADSANACSLLWPEDPAAKCPAPPPNVLFANITLRNINVRSAKQSPGVILGNVARPMENLLFENVVFENPGQFPWGKQSFKCEGVEGLANGSSTPIPPCFRRDPYTHIV